MFVVETGLDNPGKLAWWIAPTYALAEVARDILLSIIPRALIANTKRYEITLVNGFRIQYRSSDKPQNLVGDKLILVVMDEAGYMPKEVYTDFVRPTLSDNEGRAVFIGSPRGKGTAFYQWFLKGLDPLQAEWASHRMPSWYNPHIKRSEWVTVARDLPRDLYRQNIAAMWLDSHAVVFRDVEQRAGPFAQGPHPDRWYITAVDLAKHRDFTVIVTYDATNRRPVALQRFQKHGWGWTLERIVEVSKKWPGQTWVDATGVGDPIYDFLQDRSVNVMPYVLTNDSKRVLIQEYQLAIETGTITLPSEGRHGEVYIAEHAAFELDLSASGKLLFQAPNEQHDDCVIAGAIANYALQRCPVSSRSEDLYPTGSTRSTERPPDVS